jgi:hypothetical protein
MNKFEVKNATHIVFKIKDAINALTDEEIEEHERILSKIALYRESVHKVSYPEYYVVNKDEPYAKTVFNAIKNGEEEKLVKEIIHSLELYDFIIKNNFDWYMVSSITSDGTVTCQSMVDNEFYTISQMNLDNNAKVIKHAEYRNLAKSLF